jgi:hypothetical protein
LDKKSFSFDYKSISVSVVVAVFFADICDISTWLRLNYLDCNLDVERIFDNNFDYICGMVFG